MAYSHPALDENFCRLLDQLRANLRRDYHQSFDVKANAIFNVLRTESPQWRLHPSVTREYLNILKASVIKENGEATVSTEASKSKAFAAAVAPEIETTSSHVVDVIVKEEQTEDTQMIVPHVADVKSPVTKRKRSASPVVVVANKKAKKAKKSKKEKVTVSKKPKKEKETKKEKVFKACKRQIEITSDFIRREASLTLLVGELSRDIFTAKYMDYDWSIKKYLFPLQNFTRVNSLLFKSLEDGNIINCLVSAIPCSLNRLQVGIFKIEPNDWKCLVKLLGHLRNQLTNFELFAPKCTAKPPGELFAAINSLPVLKQLTLRGNFEYPMLSILGQLEAFAFHSTVAQPNLLPSLLLYGEDNFALRRIDCQADVLDLDLVFELSPHLLARFTSLNRQQPFDCEHLTAIATNFTTLNSLAINCPAMLCTLYANLSLLRSLLFLRLVVDFCTLKPDQLLGPYTQLKYLQGLELILNIRSHEEISILALGTTMPNLKVIHLKLKGCCSLCDVKSFKGKKMDQAKAKKCLVRLFTLLKNTCTKVHTILVTKPARLATVEQNLA